MLQEVLCPSYPLGCNHCVFAPVPSKSLAHVVIVASFEMRRRKQSMVMATSSTVGPQMCQDGAMKLKL
jgi:hypothetical protein